MLRITSIIMVIFTSFIISSALFGQDDALTVNEQGNVGIGTASPGVKLHIKQDADDGSDGIFTEANGSGILRMYHNGGAVGVIGVGPTDVLHLRNTGNVGIGITNPTARLHIQNGHVTVNSHADRNLDISSWDPHGIGGMSFNSRTTDHANHLPMTLGASNFYFHSGNVGIGTSNPTAKLEVAGTAYLSDGQQTIYLGTRFDSGLDVTVDNINKRGITVHSFNPVSQPALFELWSHDGAGLIPRFHIGYTGNVGLGTTTPSHPLEIANGAHVTSGGVWENASSRELKENILDLSAAEAIAVLSALAPKKYNYKIDPSEQYAGFIAEDVPDLVATGDRKSLSAMDIVAVLTKVVQLQESRIKALEAQLTVENGTN